MANADDIRPPVPPAPAGRDSDLAPGQLLATKRYPPQARPDLLRRPRLTQRLDEGLQAGRQLTLVSAPAGFGKTTLLAEWIQSRGQDTPPLRSAWVSLDEGDNDPARFLAYLAAALQTLGLPVSEGILGALRAPQPPPVDPVLAALVNDLARPPTRPAAGLPPVLILDDYHTIQARAVHDALAFLLDHLPPPPQAPHLVIASRSDPPLPLARLRARGLLAELRLADLRFTPDEVAALLRDIVGLPLSSPDLSALEKRTEGWATGLRLAALALQAATPEDGVSRYIQAFTGSHRFVLDYLVEEVLSHQPPHIHSFLLQTSILDRLSGPLCEAVCYGPDSEPAAGRHNGQAILEALERANLFIVPLDAVQRWYRYHRLFADLLRSRLDRLGAELGCAPAHELHRRASLWFESRGLLPEAVGHALTAGDHARAADLVEGQGLSMLTRGELTALLRWLDALPAAAIEARPRLCIYYAWALALSGDLDGVEPRLQAAEAGAATAPPDDRSGQIAAIRAYVAAQRGDVPRAAELAHRALALLDEDNLVVRSVVALTLGGTHLLAGDPAAAARAFAQASDMGQAAGNIHLAVPASAMLADLQVEQGRLHRAFRAYRRALEVAGHSPVAAQAHSGMGAILYEWNDLEAAAGHLARSLELGHVWGNLNALGGDYVALSWLRRAQGDLPAARDALHEAEHLAESSRLHPAAAAEVAVARVRHALAGADLAAAERWLRDCGLDPADEFDPLRQWEYATLARVLLALDQPGAASRLLARLLEAAHKGGWLGRAIEIHILQALAHDAQGEREPALDALAQALTLAEPEGYARTLLDEGQPLRPLLAGLRARLAGRPGPGDPPHSQRLLAYVDELLAAFAAAEPGHPATGPTAGLVEPLSQRELEVLRLVGAGLTNQAIADQLFVALSTVKSHTHSIYGKLGVRNRTQAIARARALGLL